MVGTGEALLKVRMKGGPASQPGEKGVGADDSIEKEFDFQGELQKFDKVDCIGSLVWVCVRGILECIVAMVPGATRASSFILRRMSQEIDDAFAPGSLCGVGRMVRN